MQATAMGPDGPATVLIVDDHPANIGVVAQALARRGHRVLVAQEGEEALERAALARADLILLDVMMPGMNGFEVCYRLKRSAATGAIPVIFMTALAEVEDKLAAFMSGAVDYVTKPLQVEEVIARVETQLKLRAMQKRLEAQNAELVAHRDNLERLVAERTAELNASNAQLRAEVAERRRAQEELAAREREFRTLAENIPDNIIRYDAEGRRRYLNRSTARLMGASAEELVGLSPEETPQALRRMPIEALAQRMRAVLRSGEPQEIEVTVHHPEAGVQVHSIKFVAERDEQGAICGALLVGRDITARKHSERELMLLNRALDHSFDATYLIDGDLRLRYVNEAAERALGYSRDELLAMGLLEIDPLMTREAIESLMEQTLIVGRFPGIIESLHRRKDGSTFPVEIGASTFKYEGETLYLTSVRDISERKAAEKLLHEQRQVLHAAVENSPDAIVRYDRQGRRVYLNDVMRRAFRRPLEQLLGTTLTDFSPLGRADEYGRLLEEVLASGEERQAELPFVVGDTVQWADLRFAPELDENGRVASVLVVGRNITERRRAEEALAESERRYRQIFDNVSDALYLFEVAPDGRFRNLEVNPAFEAATGVPREIMVGRYLEEGAFGAAIDAIIAQCRRCLEAGDSCDGEIALALPGGQRHYHSTLIPVRDEGGRVQRIVGISRDITDRKRAKTLLRKQLAMDRHFAQFARLAPGFMFTYRQEEQGGEAFLYASPGVETLFGLSADRLTEDASLFFAQLSPAEAERVRGAVRAAGAAHRSCTVEFRLEHANRVSQWLELRAAPEREQKGELLWHGYIVDISARRAIERENALLRAMAENAVDALIFTHSLDVADGLPLCYANPAVARCLGRAPEEMCGLRVRDFTEHTPEELTVHMARVRAERSLRFESVLIAKDGRRVPVDVTLSHLQHNGDEFVAAYCMDISERKEYERRLLSSERALRVSEQQFRTLAENLPDRVVRYDRSCAVVYANPKMQAQLMLKLDADPGGTLPGGEDRRRYRLALERVIATGEPEAIEVAVLSPGGRWQVHQVSFVAEHRSDGEVRGALAIGRDITAFKEAQRRLAESHAQLQELARHRESAREEERKHIARELHDELGQYLTALRLNTSALQLEFGREHPALAEKLGQSLTLVDNTKRVVRALSQRLRPAALDMGVQAALTWLLEEFTSHTGIAGRLEMENGETAVDDAGAVVLFRVVQESLTNVARHAAASAVVIRLSRSGECVVVEIRDDGRGFEPGQKRRGSLGLVGMRERLLAVGGELEVVSGPGRGTVIVAFLPVRQRELPQAPGAPG